MKSILNICCLCLILGACGGATNKTEVQAIDSAELAEDQQVEAILKNEDSLLKAKEKELLEKYSR